MKALLPALALLAALPLAAAEPTPAPGYTMANSVQSFDPAKAEPTKVGYQYWFADAALAEGKTVKLSVVGPRLATHPPHRHPEDEFFFVREGTAEFFLDGERKVVGPQTLLYCAPWHLHGIRNVGDTVLKYLVIKKYDRPAPKPSAPPEREPAAAPLPATGKCASRRG